MDNNQLIDYVWDLSLEQQDGEAQIDEAIEELRAMIPESLGESFNLNLSHFDQVAQEDHEWQSRTGLNFDSLCGAVETIIFMSDKPISIQKIKQQIDVQLPLRVLHEALSLLQKGYEEKFHGIRLVEIADGYQFRSKATYAKYVQNLFKINSLVLTPTALEVLAIVAYKQPISKTEVEKIRGVDSSHILRALMDKRLVKIVGRSEELGRPSQFGTTEEFLEVFNLANLSNLPPEYELSEMASQNTVGNIGDIKSVVFMGDKQKFNFDEIDELDKLSESIKEVQSDTLFTLNLKSEEKKKIDGIETGLKKSAFDILEDFILKDATIKQNKIASLSDVLAPVVEAKIADLDSDELINQPIIDEEWESTNNPLINDTPFNWSETDLKAESLELEEALNKAFEEMSGEELRIENENDIDEKIESLDLTLDEAILKGKDFDIDLSFLNKNEN
jgi:segregation and condensation protein B